LETAFRGTPVVESEPRAALAPVPGPKFRDNPNKFMKPTLPISSQSSHQESFPLTDYHYQSTLESSHATINETRATHDLRGFWKLSSDFIGLEGKLYYATELLLFGVIVALSGWQVITMLVAVMRLLRGY
jgi:hypothetical protein